MPKTIQVSKAFLRDKTIAKIFRSEVGQQLYLQIGTSHLRSQYFNEALLSVTRHIEKMKYRPDTVEQLRAILAEYGDQDSAVSRAFPRPAKPYISEKVAEGSCSNWKQWNQDIDDKIAKHQSAIDESDAKIMSIVKAINGRSMLKFEVI
jgi:hypothetical protein